MSIDKIQQSGATKVFEPKTTIQGSGTLQKRLLTFILPTVLIPLVTASFIGHRTIQQKTKEQVYNQLAEDTLLAAKTTNNFIERSQELTELIAAEESVVNLVTLTDGASETNSTLIESVADYLQTVVRKSAAEQIAIFQPDGSLVASTDSNQTAFPIPKQTPFGKPQLREDNAKVLPFYSAIAFYEGGNPLGMVKAEIDFATLETVLDGNLFGVDKQDYGFKIVDVRDGSVFDEVRLDNQSESSQPSPKIIELAKTISEAANRDSLDSLQQTLSSNSEYGKVSYQQAAILNRQGIVASVRYEDKVYSLVTVPNSSLVAVGAVEYSAIASAGRELLTTFALTAVVLGIFTSVLTVLFARQLANPLIKLSETTKEAAAGNFELTAEVAGTLETKTLARNFNQLIGQINKSSKHQQQIAAAQFKEKEELEAAIYTLIDEIGEATDGDLTVRASLDSMELSTVADLFNAVIESLQDIAIEAKSSSSAVGAALKENETAIRELAQIAIAEAQETRTTLVSVEEMAQSIQTVATEADRAEQIADDSYITVLQSAENMAQTVDSISLLYNTVSETEGKMKRLGESSKQIAKALTLIEEISLKTNVLAINASAEAERAGEYGQGFTVVAEQVGSLAKQSAIATREIAKIVSTIQAETAEVASAMESGTSQVKDSSQLIESTKESLALVLQKSRQIAQIVSSISETTVSQTNTSEAVTSLMQKIARLSEITSQSSEQVAKSIGETASVANNLQSTVAQFKVSEE